MKADIGISVQKCLYGLYMTFPCSSTEWGACSLNWT